MRRIHTLLSATLLAAVLAVPAHAQGGVLNRLGRTVRGAAAGSFAMSLEKERQIGREVAGVVTGRWHPVTSAALTDYVNLVGTVVAQQSPRVTEVPFRFAVLDTDEINAFAAPGGYIFVTRGALELMESEAELAGVLAHEVSHVDQKHVLEQVRKGNMITGAASENDLNGPVMDKAVETLAGVIFKGLDRGSELESDSLGMLYAAAAGYRPDGLLTFIRRLQANETSPRRGRFLAEMRATHPSNADRIAALERQGPAAQLDMASGQFLADRFRRYVPAPRR
jgi:beta-barrel assembly-enhancing protease